MVLNLDHRVEEIARYLVLKVMILIFKLLIPSERRSAITVCQKRSDLVNEYFSKDHCHGNEGEYVNVRELKLNSRNFKYEKDTLVN